jgi:exosortase H (IPTLxxWG-CTERM-specific)
MLASVLAAIAFYLSGNDSGMVELVARWTAQWSATLLMAFGIETMVDGTVIAGNRFAVRVVAECTAIAPFILFSGAVIAYPAGLRVKVYGILLGLLSLTALNIVRIASLFWIGLNSPHMLDIAHLVVWQSLMAIVAISLWLWWVGRLKHDR